MPGATGRWRSDRGAVLVHAAIAFAGILAFSALTIDLGVLWVARTQAQSAADAGALAGAVSLAFMDPSNPDAAREAASTTAGVHEVWGELVASASLQTQVGECPPGSPAIPGQCLRVELDRGGAAGSPLPAYFSRLFGVSAQQVRASASAKVVSANSTQCLRPLALADSWLDNIDTDPPIDLNTWTIEDGFDGLPPPVPIDAYEPPTAGSPGTGYTIASRGQQIRMVFDPLAYVRLKGHHLLQIDLPRPGGPGDPQARFEANVGSCNGVTASIGNTYPVFVNLTSWATGPAADLIASDPNAVWDGTGISNSNFTVSPRLMAIALIDPAQYTGQLPLAMGAEVRVTNIVGFFLERVIGSDLEGVLLPLSGNYDPAGQQLTEESSFLKAIALVR